MTEETKNNMTNEQVSSAPEVVATSPAQSAVVQSTRTQNLMVWAVGVLVVMAGIQVFQTQQLMAAVSTGSIKAGVQQTQGSSVGLPSQVGGCG